MSKTVYTTFTTKITKVSICQIAIMTTTMMMLLNEIVEKAIDFQITIASRNAQINEQVEPPANPPAVKTSSKQVAFKGITANFFTIEKTCMTSLKKFQHDCIRRKQLNFARPMVPYEEGTMEYLHYLEFILMPLIVEKRIDVFNLPYQPGTVAHKRFFEFKLKPALDSLKTKIAMNAAPPTGPCVVEAICEEVPKFIVVRGCKRRRLLLNPTEATTPPTELCVDERSPSKTLETRLLADPEEQEGFHEEAALEEPAVLEQEEESWHRRKEQLNWLIVDDVEAEALDPDALEEPAEAVITRKKEKEKKKKGRSNVLRRSARLAHQGLGSVFTEGRRRSARLATKER